MKADHTVTVEFETLPTGNFELSLLVDDGGTISVNPQSADNQYASGTELTLTATPKDDWSFVHWEGNVNDSTKNVTTIRMDRDQTVKAVFAQNTSPEDTSTPTSSSDSGGGCFISMVSAVPGAMPFWPILGLAAVWMVSRRKKEN